MEYHTVRCMHTYSEEDEHFDNDSRPGSSFNLALSCIHSGLLHLNI
jgi:hypothetical protein